MDIRKFWTQCRLHDWHYEMSEDPEAYRMGKENEDYLLSLAHKDPAMADMFKQWKAYQFTSAPRPIEPKIED